MAQDVRDALKGEVAVQMGVGVVVFLEVVDIEEQEGEHLTKPRCALRLLDGVRHERAIVAQARQLVGHRELIDAMDVQDVLGDQAAVRDESLHHEPLFVCQKHGAFERHVQDTVQDAFECYAECQLGHGPWGERDHSVRNFRVDDRNAGTAERFGQDTRLDSGLRSEPDDVSLADDQLSGLRFKGDVCRSVRLHDILQLASRGSQELSQVCALEGGVEQFLCRESILREQDGALLQEDLLHDGLRIGHEEVECTGLADSQQSVVPDAHDDEAHEALLEVQPTHQQVATLQQAGDRARQRVCYIQSSPQLAFEETDRCRLFRAGGPDGSPGACRVARVFQQDDTPRPGQDSLQEATEMCCCLLGRRDVDVFQLCSVDGFVDIALLLDFFPDQPSLQESLYLSGNCEGIRGDVIGEVVALATFQIKHGDDPPFRILHRDGQLTARGLIAHDVAVSYTHLRAHE